MSRACDMCGGSGLESFYVYDDGSPVLMTTDMEANKLIEQSRDEWEIEEHPCSTCGGTGKMPDWIEESYKRIEVKDAKENADEQNWLPLNLFDPLDIFKL